jgi:hypothetical protein
MKKITISLSVILLNIFLSGNVFSQSDISLHVGPSFPLSDFGSDDKSNDDAGGAGIGFNLGGQYLYHLNDKGFGLFAGADLIYNGLKKSVKDDIKDSYSNAGYDVDITFYKYINVPIIAGLNYTYKANETVSLFCDFGIGLDLFKVTDMTIEESGEKAEVSFDMSSKFAYKLGAGLLLNDKFSIGAYYYGLGSHNPDGKIKVGDETADMETSALKVNALTVALGIKF